MERAVSVERRAPRRNRGQALTEFALVVPILLLMMVGIIEFGRAWYMSQVIGDAARQGARTAAILNGSGVSQDSVNRVVGAALLAGSIDPDDADIDIDGYDDGTNLPVTVTVSVPYDFGVFGPVMRFAGQSWDDAAIMLTSSSIMRNE